MKQVHIYIRVSVISQMVWKSRATPGIESLVPKDVIAILTTSVFICFELPVDRNISHLNNMRNFDFFFKRLYHLKKCVYLGLAGVIFVGNFTYYPNTDFKNRFKVIKCSEMSKNAPESKKSKGNYDVISFFCIYGTFNVPGSVLQGQNRILRKISDFLCAFEYSSNSISLYYIINK